MCGFGPRDMGPGKDTNLLLAPGADANIVPISVFSICWPPFGFPLELSIRMPSFEHSHVENAILDQRITVAKSKMLSCDRSIHQNNETKAISRGFV